MTRAIFFDVDGLLPSTLSGHALKKSPQDIAVLPGVKAGLNYYYSQTPPWLFFGISNQFVGEDPEKKLSDAIEEMQYTLELLPKLTSIYLCPDKCGKLCFEIGRDKNSIKLIKQKNVNYCKPGAGMLFQARAQYGIDLEKSWMIGLSLEDEQCAAAMGVNFMWADIWRERFTPGIYKVKPVIRLQVKFLEA